MRQEDVRELLDWFLHHQREMPWRSNPIPYWVWISEAMLQQTQVATVIPYFHRFIQRFPTVDSLAGADLQDILKMWEGLGYYSRARNLHRAAISIMTQFNGQIPDDYVTLQTLPGFGPYIAAAVVSIAFEKAVPVVDGNVLRVFSRYWAIADDISAGRTRSAIFSRLVPVIQHVRPSQFNQAIMELGALYCTPKSPACPKCPVRSGCEANATQQVDRFPVKAKKAAVPHFTIGVGVIWHGGRLLVTRRKEDQMLGGLWEFPGGKQLPGEGIVDTIRREITEELDISVTVGDPIQVVKHAYSHFKITMIAHHCTFDHGDIKLKSASAMKWVWPHELREFPFPKANTKIIDTLLKECP